MQNFSISSLYNYYFSNPVERTISVKPPKEEATPSSLKVPCRFFVIKSSNEDNIHKSIKYRIWSSTIKGNKILHEAFLASKSHPILLFFSVNGSRRFVGVAQMISDVQYETNFNLWLPEEEWKGFFFVKWVYIKDIPNKAMLNIRNKITEKCVTESRNATEVDYGSGLEMMSMFQNYKSESSIIDDFSYYEFEENKLNK